MNCERCVTRLEAGESRNPGGKELCEDCHISALNPPSACDPGAVQQHQQIILAQF